MRGGALAIEQPRGREHEDAGADRDQLNRKVKKMLGGIEGWKWDGFELESEVRSQETGTLDSSKIGIPA